MTTTIILCVIAVELALGIYLMTRIGWQADQQRRDIWQQIFEIWHVLRNKE